MTFQITNALSHTTPMKLRKLALRLWRDEVGGLLSTEYVLLGTLLTLGLVVGFSATRVSLVTEFEDYAAALLGIDCGGLTAAGVNDATMGDDPITFAGNEGGITP